MPPAGKTSAFAVVPEFLVKPECIDAFLALAQDDASHSVADEPGCQQFDVVQVEGAPHQDFLYEVYDDRAGFPALIQEERPVRFATRYHE